MTTEKQIKANIENSKKSTGPKDTSKTRFNGLKHGLFSKKVLSIVNKEGKKFINSVKKGLIKQFGPPDNIVEEILYEKFQIACWRLRHVNEIEMINREREFKCGLIGDIESSVLESSFSGISTTNDPRTDKKSYNLVYSPITPQTELIFRYKASAEREFYRILEEIKKCKNGFVSKK